MNDGSPFIFSGSVFAGSMIFHTGYNREVQLSKRGQILLLYDLVTWHKKCLCT